MTKRAMAEVRDEGFGLIKPVVDYKIVFGLATEFSGAALRVLEWMGHGYTSYVVVV
jgi:hypothetical protein